MVTGKESPTHTAFKKIAVDILKEKGFKPDEIKEEYFVEYNGDGRTRYEIDVVGINRDYKIAVECGITEYSKILNLQKIFNEVIVVDAFKVVELYNYWKTLHYKDVMRLSQEVHDLKGRMVWVCRDANKSVEEIETKIKPLKKENNELRLELKKLQKVIAEAWEANKQS